MDSVAGVDRWYDGAEVEWTIGMMELESEWIIDILPDLEWAMM